jgi:hypothetical protein
MSTNCERRWVKVWKLEYATGGHNRHGGRGHEPPHVADFRVVQIIALGAHVAGHVYLTLKKSRGSVYRYVFQIVVKKVSAKGAILRIHPLVAHPKRIAGTLVGEVRFQRVVIGGGLPGPEQAAHVGPAVI